MNVCKKCGSEFEGTRCRPCANKSAAIYRDNNREKMAAASKKWQLENPEKYQQSLKNYKDENHEKIIATHRLYRSKNQEKIRAVKRQWARTNSVRLGVERRAKYAANPSAVLDVMAKWRAKNKDKVAEWTRRWRRENPDKVAAIKARWYSNNKDAYIAYSHTRRARVRLIGGRLSKGLKSKLYAKQKGLCACCKKPLGRSFHLDHIMPLALGGENKDANIQLLRSICNLQKSAKHPVDFMRERGYLI